MEDPRLAIALLCSGVGIVVFFAARWFATLFEPDKRDRDEDDLHLDEPTEPVFGPMTEPLANQVPVSEEGEKDATKLLRQAGYFSPRAVKDYYAVRYIAVILPIVVTALLALQVDEDQLMLTLIVGAIVTALGYVVPRLMMDQKAKRRRRECERGLPVAVDLLCLGLVGGQTINAALKRVAKEIRYAFPALSQELRVIRYQSDVGGMSTALRQWAERMEIPDIHNLVVLLTQAERQGVDISQGLMDFSNGLRLQTRQRADAQANRANVWLIFPTIFCLWLPAAMMLVGPILFELRGRISETRQTTQEIQQQAEDIVNQ